MRVAVYGLGYVGATVAACTASLGHDVTGVDISETKVADINAGRSPVAEPGLDEMMSAAVRDGRLRAMIDIGTELNDCSLAIVCVGTPSTPDGSHNMSFIAEVSRQIAAAVDCRRTQPLTVVYRSTMRPGTTEELIAPIFHETLNGDTGVVDLVYNPEFLRESTAIRDFFEPPKVVVGTADGNHNSTIDQWIDTITAPTFYTRYRDAEFVKFVDNAFHALKVCYANEVGRVGAHLGLDTKKIHDIFVADTKLNISPYYFNPGNAFGGSCLPKDVRALQKIAADLGAATYVVDSLIQTNEAHKHFLFTECTKGLSPGASILMLGLAFKDRTDDLRESPNIDLARKLLNARYDLSIYDPYVVPSRLLGQNLGYAFSSLPSLRKLLISKEDAQARRFDLIIDHRNWTKGMGLQATRTFYTELMRGP